MNLSFFLAKRITLTGRRTFSRLIVRVAVLTVAVGVAAMILAIAVLNGFKDEVSSKQRGFFGDISITDSYDYDELEQSPIFLPATTVGAIQSHPEVIELRRFANKPGIINVNDEVEGVVLKGIDSLYNQDFIEDVLVGGSKLDFSDSTAVNGQILISQHTANRLELEVGDDFIMYFVQEPIRRRKFTIQGIFHTSAQDLDKTYVIGALPLIQRLNDWDSEEVGGLEIRVQDFGRVQESRWEVNDLLPAGLSAISLRDRFPEIFQWLDLLDANPQIILALMMIVALINMISALLIIILEKTPLIGMLKTFGYPDSGIRQVFLYQAVYLVGLGLMIGNALALGLYFLQKNTRIFTLDEASYYVSYVPLDISLMEVLILNVGVLCIAILVLFIPAYLISKIHPIRTIQFR